MLPLQAEAQARLKVAQQVEEEAARKAGSSGFQWEVKHTKFLYNKCTCNQLLQTCSLPYGIDSSTLRWIQTLDPVFLHDAARCPEFIRPRSMQRRKPREKLQRRQERQGLWTDSVVVGKQSGTSGYSDVNTSLMCVKTKCTTWGHIVFLIHDCNTTLY